MRNIASSGSVVNFRLTVIAACLGWFTQKYLKSRLLPHGSPQRQGWHERPSYATIDKTNDSLQAKHGKLQKIFERVEEGKPKLLKGPESLFFDNDGVLYTATHDGSLISLTDVQTDSSTGKTTAKTTKIKDLGVGRPLGAKFTNKNTLYIADAVLGLTRVQNPQDPKSKLEIVATTVVDGTRILYADDLAVGPKTGHVYFTDASEIYPERDLDMTWDVMYASKVEAMRGPSGRLLRYDPTTDEVTILARDLWFANGVAVDKEEKYVIFAETFSLRVCKYYLTGEKKGTLAYIVDGDPSPAYFDGVDCAWNGITAKSSLCYAVCPSSVVPAHKILWNLPHPIDVVFRTLLMMLPKKLAPPTKPYAGITIIDPETNAYVGLIQDPTGADISGLTGITLHDNKLYLGSLHNDFIGVYDLS